MCEIGCGVLSNEQGIDSSNLLTYSFKAACAPRPAACCETSQRSVACLRLRCPAPEPHSYPDHNLVGRCTTEYWVHAVVLRFAFCAVMYLFINVGRVLAVLIRPLSHSHTYTHVITPTVPHEDNTCRPPFFV